jgi:hypothetical protein
MCSVLNGKQGKKKGNGSVYVLGMALFRINDV